MADYEPLQHILLLLDFALYKFSSKTKFLPFPKSLNDLFSLH